MLHLNVFMCWTVLNDPDNDRLIKKNKWYVERLKYSLKFFLTLSQSTSQNGQTLKRLSAKSRRIVWVCLIILWDWHVKGLRTACCIGVLIWVKCRIFSEYLNHSKCIEKTNMLLQTRLLFTKKIKVNSLFLR